MVPSGREFMFQPRAPGLEAPAEPRVETVTLPTAATAVAVAVAAGAMLGGYTAAWWMRRNLKKKRAPKRVAGLLKLRPEKEIEYRQLHEHTWQEVMQTMYENNMRNFSVFLHKPSYQLFSYYEYIGSDYEGDMARIARDPVVKSWWSFCEPCQEPLNWHGSPPSQGGSGGGGDNEWWATLTNINHCGAWPVYFSDRMPDPDFQPPKVHDLKTPRAGHSDTGRKSE
ncbi:Hypothetical Protein FCC1311_002832 [Hondaea fermentalgiana]|uniref:L-rhamnose mutarotase n=1 Tax=Hondaea fermentalgiana TaxID=2315210 RepID=A0A2R5G0L6_9STRA|nr:Hypothetical Protein FCC1311_002832 [Hondaea fermentalgiana]|eukprot:GBG24065.1 Hypothetical Protein FCC1311_002832 [Hondaea fermentalgiana]